ncbi:MAG: FtsW/RodA/SpoVE family cell cycle protein [Planctomycetota bacterium]|jgi:cell division protein FtsW
MLAAVCLCCLGLVMAVSIQGPRLRQGPLLALQGQGAKLAFGLVAFLCCVMVPLELLRRSARLLFLATTGLCYVAALFGTPVHSARRWINFAGMQFQPADLARLGVVLFTAALIAEAGNRIRTFRAGFLRTTWPAALLAFALLLQPDNGNAAFVLALVACMTLVAGVAFRWFALLGLPALAVFAAMALTRPYVKHRLVGFLDIQPGSQVGQSLVAISSGGLTGQGLGNGWMKMGFVPEARNDFVFAVVGEELGLMGSLVVLALYGTIGYTGYRLVMATQDRFYRYLILGLTLAICMQAAINLLVVTGMAPAKGIDLPFVSSGGTNLVLCLAAVGLIGNAARADAREHL